MIGLLWFVLAVLVSPFRSNAGLEAENAALRQQVIVLQRKCQGRVRLTNGDRLFSSSCNAGFLRYCGPFRSFALRRWFVGIGRAFAATCDGNPGIREGARRSIRSYGR